MKRGKLKILAVITIGLLLGYAIAGQLNAFLGISFTTKDLPQEAVYSPDPPIQPAAPLAPAAAIILPDGALQDELYTNAATALADQYEARSGQRPAIVDTPDAASAGRHAIRDVSLNAVVTHIQRCRPKQPIVARDPRMPRLDCLRQSIG